MHTGDANRACGAGARYFRLTIWAGAIASLYASTAELSANDVLPGLDLWTTPPGASYEDFRETPIPADFFDPGSDPFDGIVYWVGVPLAPISSIALTDTIVRRPALAPLPTCGTGVQIPIEIVSLSLTSIQPITVTYNNGLNPELWNVDVCLSSIPQPQGTMTIEHDCAAGGTFTSELPVLPKLVFTRVSDSAVRTLDFGVAGMQPLVFRTGCPTGWVHVPDAMFGVTTAAPGSIPALDVDCDGILDAPIPEGTSNFAAGIEPMPCNCIDPTVSQRKRLVGEAALWAAHGVKVSEEQKLGDTDGDGHDDIYDNCMTVANPDQCDMDCNSVGDACQTDDGSCIPAVSTWGLTAMLLLVICAGTVVILRRHRAAAA